DGDTRNAWAWNFPARGNARTPRPGMRLSRALSTRVSTPLTGSVRPQVPKLRIILANPKFLPAKPISFDRLHEDVSHARPQTGHAHVNAQARQDRRRRCRGADRMHGVRLDQDRGGLAHLAGRPRARPIRVDLRFVFAQPKLPGAVAKQRAAW